MRVLLTSAGLETQEIKDTFISLASKDMAMVKALFIPTAAINASAVEVLPKCMNDLLKCGIRDENISVFDLHKGMEIQELQQYDVVYICGGDASYLLGRMNATGFAEVLMRYIRENGMVIGVSAGSIIFADNLENNLGLIDSVLNVHCMQGEKRGRLQHPLKKDVRLTNTCALVIRDIPNEIEIIGE